LTQEPVGVRAASGRVSWAARNCDTHDTTSPLRTLAVLTGGVDIPPGALNGGLGRQSVSLTEHISVAARRLRLLATDATIAICSGAEPSPDVLSFAALARARCPQVRIVLVAPGANPPQEVLLRAGRCGVDDVWTPTALRAFLTTGNAHRVAKRRPGDDLLAELARTEQFTARIVNQMLGAPAVVLRVPVVARSLGLSDARFREIARREGMTPRAVIARAAALATAIRLSRLHPAQTIDAEALGLRTLSQMAHLLRRRLGLRISQCKGDSSPLMRVMTTGRQSVQP
jgi:hypothetical protein